MVGRSAFEDWFIDQHGVRELTNIGRSDDDLREMIWRGELAGRELGRREKWDARKESALYAWQVKERV